jgi:hypothetical protein
MLRKRIRAVEPPAALHRTAERAPTFACGSAAVTSALREVAISTAVAAMAVATAVVDGSAA